MINNWKNRYPDDYDHLIEDITHLVIEAKQKTTLDLLQNWYLISYVFTEDVPMEIRPFLVEENNGIKINAILCGQEIDEYTRYLEPVEVREVAGALARISPEMIQSRFEERISKQSEEYEKFLELCFDVIDFYNDAAKRGNAMLIDIS